MTRPSGAGERVRETVAGLLLCGALWTAAGVAGPFGPPRGNPDGPGSTRLVDPQITESSGLVATGELLVTVNDSGDSGRIFTVDRSTGQTVGVTRWAEQPEDVEALAPAGEGAVWVGDTGDNGGDRPSIRLLRVPFGRWDRTVDPPGWELAYPDGPRDAEALLAVPEGAPGAGRLVVVSKGVFGGGIYLTSRRLSDGVPPGPRDGGTTRLVRRGDAPGLVTGGAFWSDGKHLLLRSYREASVYTWPGLQEVGSFDLPHQQQGESLALDPQGRVLLSSEGVRQPVLVAPVPADLRGVLTDSGKATGDAGVAPAPSPLAPAAPSQPGPGDGATPSGTADAGTAQGPWGWLLGGGAVVLVGLALGAARWRHGHQRRAG